VFSSTSVPPDRDMSFVSSSDFVEGASSECRSSPGVKISLFLLLDRPPPLRCIFFVFLMCSEFLSPPQQFCYVGRGVVSLLASPCRFFDRSGPEGFGGSRFCLIDSTVSYLGMLSFPRPFLSSFLPFPRNNDAGREYPSLFFLIPSF